MNRLLLSLATVAGLTLTSLPVPAAGEQATRPNVLFIAIDDLRNDLGALGVPYARTPYLDRLAATGRLFTNHYAVVPTCGASRCALMRGRYPDRAEQVGNDAIRRTQSEWAGQSLPAWMRAHGYRTLSLGKITHYPGNRTGKDWAEGPEELPGAWDRAWIPETSWKNAAAMMHGYANGRPRDTGKSPAWEAFDGPDSAYPDYWVAGDAVRTLQELAKSTQPWLFAVGFFKPHLPFAAPKPWFDLHASDQIPPPAVTSRPPEPSGWHRSSEFRGQYADAKGRNPDTNETYAHELRLAYAAATSYADAQVGKVLAALRELGLEDDTIVVVWSDHGFLLGEHAIWGKHTLYENALRSPLIVRAPGMGQRGAQARAVVDAVDVFPTLLDLCGLPAPDGLDGRSLRPQLTDPAAPTAKPARGFWNDGKRTIRTDRWRLTAHPRDGQAVPDVELYDMVADPHESHNVAATEPEVVKQLLGELAQVPGPSAAVSGKP